MAKPALVIMAAGMGSRFGGLKQITPVDDYGHAILDFSLFDAKRAGFDTVVFIIKHAIEKEFKEAIGNRMEQYFDVRYVYQELDVLPEGYTVPEGRTKPWGTAHAILTAAPAIDGSFAVINADDFYGRTAFSTVYDFLSAQDDENKHAMVAYRLRNTVTENGSVSRGICTAEDGYLKDVTECLRIEKDGNDARTTEDEGKTWTPLSGDTLVSMNLWGFGHGILDAFQAGFPAFLDRNLPVNPMKCEYFLPVVADQELKAGRCTVRLLPCDETWYGMTYREDIPSVKAAIENMKRQGIYPDKLWE